MALERKRPRELHRTGRIGWLRAAVLGANDGIVSTASLVIGVAAAGAPRSEVLVAGVAGLVAGRPVDGGGRVRLGQLPGRHRARRPRARARRAARRARRRAGRAHRDLRRPRTRARAGPHGRAAVDGPRCARRRTRATSSACPTDFAARPLQAALASAATFAVGAGLPLLTVTLAPSGSAVPHGGRRVPGLPGRAWRAGGPRGRRVRGDRRAARRLLGRAGDGGHGGRRCALRCGGLTGREQVTTRTISERRDPPSREEPCGVAEPRRRGSTRYPARAGRSVERGGRRATRAS